MSREHMHVKRERYRKADLSQTRTISPGKAVLPNFRKSEKLSTLKYLSYENSLQTCEIGPYSCRAGAMRCSDRWLLQRLRRDNCTCEDSWRACSEDEIDRNKRIMKNNTPTSARDDGPPA